MKQIARTATKGILQKAEIKEEMFVIKIEGSLSKIH